MATTNERATQERSGESFVYDVADDAVINRGAMVMLVAGMATAGAVAAGAVCVGMAKHSAYHADGDLSVEAQLGCFAFANSSTDPLDDADVGSDCFIEDDETVSKTDDGGARSRAGKVREIDGNQVWVAFS